MNRKKNQLSKIPLLFLVVVFTSKIAVSQTDTTIKQNVQSSDTIKNEPKKKKSSGFIAYGSATFNQLSMSTQYESNSNVGWALGVAYRRGRFFYWQIGARYNNAIYDVKNSVAQPGTSNTITVKDIDIPINIGLNLLSVTGKILGLRVYVGAVPAFLISAVDNNSTNFTKTNANSFIFYGQGGIGVDVLFLSIDAGYNYGFTDVSKTTGSKPGQAFVNLGFRF